MAQKKLALNKDLKPVSGVSGVMGVITGRTPGEEDTQPLDKPEPPLQPAESAPAEVAPEPQQLDTGDHPVNAADTVVTEEEPEGPTPQRPRKSPKPDAQAEEDRGKEARRGRPPGQVQVATAPMARKKVTLMIRTDLVEKYNAWSWGAQCNVGRLYERALEDYYQRKGPKESK
jgi:hypothetical protein